MSFNWKLYIDLAKELLDGQRGKDPYKEAHLRTVISRAYYGIFCIARNHLQNRGIQIPDGTPHKFVREVYIESANGLEKRIGENLGRLLRRRNTADYENEAIINFSEASTAFQQAQRTLQYLLNLKAV